MRRIAPILLLLVASSCHLMEPVRKGMVESTEIASTKLTVWFDGAIEKLLDKMAEKLAPRMPQQSERGPTESWVDLVVVGGATFLAREGMHWYRTRKNGAKV